MIMRKQFAVLDELDNYSFRFIPGFDDNDVYPCEYNIIIMYLSCIQPLIIINSRN